MIRKKRCPRCEEKIKPSYEFCPACGIQIKNSEKDYGVLGKNDFIKEQDFPLLGGFSGGIINKMMGGAIKMLEKEIRREFKENAKQPATKIRLMINGKEITPMTFPQQKPEKSKEKKKIPITTLPVNFSSENLKKFKKLNKKEPKTQVRRIGDKLTYELDIQGVE